MRIATPSTRPAGAVALVAVTRTSVGLACVLLVGCLKLSPTSLQFGLLPSTLTFHAAPRGTNPAAQDVSVTNAGVVGSLTGLATSISYDSQGSGWLTVSLSSTASPSTMSVQPATGSLSASTYTATISVSATGALNGPQTVSVTFVVGSAPPAAPVLGAVTPGESQVTVTWAASTGATSYNVYYAQGSTVTTGTGTKVAGVSSPYTLGSLSDGQQYAFLVTAADPSGESAGSNTLTTPAGVPPRIRFIRYDATHVYIPSFMTVAGALSYNVYYQAGSTVTPTTGTQVTNYTQGNAVATLTTGTQYAFLVAPEYAVGEGPASAVVTATPSSTPAIGDNGITTVNEVVAAPIPASASIPFPIVNAGGGTLSGLSASVTYSGAATGWLTVDTETLGGLNLASGQQGGPPLTISLPIDLSGATAATITFSGSGAAPLVVHLTCTPDASGGTDLVPFTLSPALSESGTYDFGAVTVGSTVAGVIFALRNESATITLGSPYADIPSIGPFQLTELTTEGTQLAGAAVAYFAISYDPSALGATVPETVTVGWTGPKGGNVFFSVAGSGQ